ncbi:hypothetical protein V5799_006213 [Amblyomma americanum]|uniref:Uncharacterized protein n=1 Tax=Amblyomma americanum TaxID=6943 RepID=A0AAQ4DX15_AMBAM
MNARAAVEQYPYSDVERRILRGVRTETQLSAHCAPSRPSWRQRLDNLKPARRQTYLGGQDSWTMASFFQWPTKPADSGCNTSARQASRTLWTSHPLRCALLLSVLFSVPPVFLPLCPLS